MATLPEMEEVCRRVAQRLQHDDLTRVDLLNMATELQLASGNISRRLDEIETRRGASDETRAARTGLECIAGSIGWVGEHRDSADDEAVHNRIGEATATALAVVQALKRFELPG